MNRKKLGSAPADLPLPGASPGGPLRGPIWGRSAASQAGACLRGPGRAWTKGASKGEFAPQAVGSFAADPS